MTNSIKYYGMALVEIENGNYERAIQLLEKSLDISKHFKTYHKLGEVFLLMGMEEDALQNFSKAYKENPKNDKTALEYAKCLIKNKKTSCAIKILKKILQNNPTYKPAKIILKGFQ